MFLAIQKSKKIGQNRHFLTSWGGSLTLCHTRDKNIVPRGNDIQSFHWIHDLPQ